MNLLPALGVLGLLVAVSLGVTILQILVLVLIVAAALGMRAR